MKATGNYYVKRFARDSWMVMSPSGTPVYDNAPHGKDKPLVFHDEDAALDFAARCNRDSNQEDKS